LLLIVAVRRQRAAFDQIVPHNLAATAFGNVLHAILRLDAFVNVRMTGQHQVDLVFNEEGMQLITHA